MVLIGILLCGANKNTTLLCYEECCYVVLIRISLRDEEHFFVVLIGIFFFCVTKITLCGANKSTTLLC